MVPAILEPADRIADLLLTGHIDPGFSGNYRDLGNTNKCSPLPAGTGDHHNSLSFPFSLTRSNGGRQHHKAGSYFMNDDDIG